MENREKCPLCEVVPSLQYVAKILLIYAEQDLLLNKLIDNLIMCGYKLEIQDGVAVLRDVPVEEFLLKLSGCGFSEREVKDIKVAPLEKESYGVDVLKSFKPLEVWLSYLLGQEFLSILREGRLAIHYHPILDYEKGQLHGYECLLRALREDGTTIPPSWLFETARKAGMIFYLDREARQLSIKEASKKLKENAKIFINFMPNSIYDPAYCLRTTTELAYNTGIDPSRIVFEVVETEKVEDKAHLRKILDYYRHHGFKVALDDVGEGYSSINLLIQLNPDYVKLDMELVRDIHKSSIKKDFVSSIVASLKKNGIEVIAEGVEQREELKQLLQIGVKLFQGFLFAKPAPEPTYEINW